MMKRLVVVLGLLAPVLTLSSATPLVAQNAASGFVSAIDDLPLMPGLNEDADALVVFEAPSGRIVEAVATGAVSVERVVSFYAATLPALGWEPHSTGGYARETDILRIATERAEGGGVIVRFSIVPSAGSAKR